MKLFFTVAMLGLLCVPAQAQLRPKAKAILKQKQAKQQKQADAVERFLAMSPEDRRQALAQLPPAHQRQILQRLNALELLSPEDRQSLRGRMQAFSDLPAGHREAVRVELRSLRAMSNQERRRRFDSDEFQRIYSDDERQLLRDVFGQPRQQEE